MMELNPNYKSILELDKRLVDLNIEHELHRMDDGYIIYYPNHIDRIGDVIEHKSSYGHEVDQMEAYMFEECGDDVLGYLSVDEALELFINANKKKKRRNCIKENDLAGDKY